MIILENETMKAVISPLGAELQSLVNKQTGIEYMWSGDANFWGKHSPVLFPIVGGLKGDTYFYKDKTYHLPRHGFARTQVFLQDQISKSEAVFTLQQNADTLKNYPFAFSLQLRYSLQKEVISCTYAVNNPGYEDLFFSVGAHPAFAVPMVTGTTYSDYYLQFNQPEQLQRWKLEDGLISDHSEALATRNDRIDLQHSLFYEDAMVLKKLHSNTITLGSAKHQHGLHFHFTDFPFFGIWAAREANFICLEPWCGIADSVQHNQQLSDKEGIIRLAPKANWQRSWQVACF